MLGIAFQQVLKFLHYLQLASHDLANIYGRKVSIIKIQKFKFHHLVMIMLLYDRKSFDNISVIGGKDKAVFPLLACRPT